MEKEIRKEEIGKVSKELLDKYDLEQISEIIKDNKIDFEYKDNKYRVRLLNSSEKAELDLLRRQKFGELLKNKDILFEKEIIKLYKERGINIEEIDDKIKKMQTELKDIMFKLGESIEKKDPESIWKKYKEDKTELLNEITELVLQKGVLLQNSFEKTLENYIIEVMSFLSLDILKDSKYIRAFKTNEEFLKADEKLVSETIIRSMTLNQVV